MLSIVLDINCYYSIFMLQIYIYLLSLQYLIKYLINQFLTHINVYILNNLYNNKLNKQYFKLIKPNISIY